MGRDSFWTSRHDAGFPPMLLQVRCRFLPEFFLISTFLWIFLRISTNLVPLSRDDDGRAALMLSPLS